MAKVKYVVAKVPGLTLSTKTGNSEILIEVGDRVRAANVSEDFIELIEEGDERASELAELVEVDTEEEAKRIKAHEEAVAAIQESEGGDPDEAEQDGGSPGYDPNEHTVQEVLDYLKGIDDPLEVERVKALEAAGDRGSTQINAYGAQN